MTQADRDFVDRPRGILTQKEREFLLGMLDEDERETADAIRQREYRIRQHIRHSLIDYSLISAAYDINASRAFEDLHRVLFLRGDDQEVSDDESNRWPMYNDPDLAGGIKSMFNFLYMGLGAVDPDKEYSSFVSLLRSGVKEALVRLNAWYGVSVRPRVRFHISIDNRVPLEAVNEAYNREKYISNTEADALYWGGWISFDERREIKDKNHAILSPDNMDEVREKTDSEEERREADAIDEAKWNKMSTKSVEVVMRGLNRSWRND